MAKLRPITFEIDSSGCFVCTSHANDGKGYRRLGYKLMHRHIYEECFGEIPDGLVLRHKCDNRACINPEHLETGTRADNARDMKERGRANRPRGSANNRAVLNEQQVLEIKCKLREGVPYKVLSIEYGVSDTTISHIKVGRTWSHL